MSTTHISDITLAQQMQSRRVEEDRLIAGMWMQLKAVGRTSGREVDERKGGRVVREAGVRTRVKQQ